VDVCADELPEPALTDDDVEVEVWAFEEPPPEVLPAVVPVDVDACVPGDPVPDWLVDGSPVDAELEVFVAACVPEDPVPDWLVDGAPVEVELEVLVEA
jgi:hypothetical protein